MSIDSQIKDFNGLQWHDSKLLDVELTDGERGHNVVLTLEMRVGPVDAPASERKRLYLTDAREIKLDFDLIGKQQVSHDLWTAQCESKDQQNLRFTFELIEPGGNLEVTARAFHFS